jgi:hypothetical protein
MPIDNIIHDGHVFFYLSEIEAISAYFSIQVSEIFLDNRYRLYATPAEPYTAYEKLLLPFDTKTWILLIATFLVTLVIILIINKLSRRAQNIVYGRQVETSIWNVVSIFFGISQTKLSTINSSRFIVILLIIFCLILRTCWQSKSFEFMTSEPRRSPPKSLTDLMDNNYTIVTVNKLKMEELLDDEVVNW